MREIKSRRNVRPLIKSKSFHRFSLSLFLSLLISFQVKSYEKEVVPETSRYNGILNEKITHYTKAEKGSDAPYFDKNALNAIQQQEGERW